MTQQKKNYVLPIAMMFALFAMISFVTGLTNPLGLIVKEQFQAANWMTQLGNAANFIAYAFMGLPAGMMLKRSVTKDSPYCRSSRIYRSRHSGAFGTDGLPAR